MSRILNFPSPGSTKAGSVSLETIQAKGRGGPKVEAAIDCSVAVPTPQRPVDVVAGPPKKFVPASVAKTYPVGMVRKLMRNGHRNGSAVDLQLLRSMRWPI